MAIRFFRYYILGIVLPIAFVACQNSEATGSDNRFFVQLRGYELARPSILHLPESLAEVSGILFYPKDSSIICINDNEGVIYKFPLYEKMHLEKWPVSGGEDFEEIVLQDSTFYAVQSNGSITTLRATPKGFIKKVFENPVSAKFREFEAVVYDSISKYLLLICKDCEDDQADITSVWAYNPATDSMLSDPLFQVDQTAIERILGRVIEKFKPSAAAVHPITGDIYMVSAINDLIVVMDRQGVVKEACEIDKVLFKQPEGLAFTPAGDLIISNEYAYRGRANLLVYKYDGASIKSVSHSINKHPENEK